MKTCSAPGASNEELLGLIHASAEERHSLLCIMHVSCLQILLLANLFA